MEATRTCHECRRTLPCDDVHFDVVQAHGADVRDNVCKACRQAIGGRAWDAVNRQDYMGVMGEPEGFLE